MEEDRPISCKVVMIGNSGVGKTSLVNTWVNGQYNPKASPTIGANHLRKIVQSDDATLDVCVWDTAGQEQYHSLAPLYTRAAATAIAVASITDKDSFDSLEMWLKLVNESCDEVPPIILAVSKMDLSEKQVMTPEEIENKYGDKFEGIFYTSSVSGENVTTLFVQAAKTAYGFLKESGKIPSTALKSDQEEIQNDKKKCC